MANKATEYGDGSGWAIRCPACLHDHQFPRAGWSFNGDLEYPTFSPSLKTICQDAWTKIPQDQWMPMLRSEKSNLRIPFALLDEQHAQKLHGGQTLQRLRERGGLSLCEAICHLERINLWDRKPTAGDATIVSAKVKTWLDALPPSICHSVVSEGRIMFLDDCTHPLVGQVVQLEDFEAGR